MNFPGCLPRGQQMSYRFTCFPYHTPIRDSLQDPLHVKILENHITNTDVVDGRKQKQINGRMSMKYECSQKYTGVTVQPTVRLVALFVSLSKRWQDEVIARHRLA